MGLLLKIERTLMTPILTGHACVTGNYADPCIICTSAKGEKNHMLSPTVASLFLLLGIISDKKEMAGKMEIANYFSQKPEPFLLHMKDIKGESINIVGIYALQVEFQGKKTEKKSSC